MRRIRPQDERKVGCIVVCVGLLFIGVFGAVMFAVVHFILKYW